MNSAEGLKQVLDAEERACNYLRQGQEVAFDSVWKKKGFCGCSLRVIDIHESVDCLFHFKQIEKESDRVERIRYDGVIVEMELFITARNFAKDVIRIMVESLGGKTLTCYETEVGGNTDHRMF